MREENHSKGRIISRYWYMYVNAANDAERLCLLQSVLPTPSSCSFIYTMRVSCELSSTIEKENTQLGVVVRSKSSIPGFIRREYQERKEIF